MRDETDFTAITLQARKDAGATLSWARIAGYAGALVLHGLLLLTVLRPGADSERAPRITHVPESAAEPGMALVLLDAQVSNRPAPAARPKASAQLPTMTVTWSAPAPTTSSPDPAAVTETPESRSASAIPDLATLEAQIEGVARDLAGPLRERAIGQLPQMPGQARAIIPLHAPVKRWKQITPEQVGGVLARIFVATMAGNPDDHERARELRDPLQDWTSSHLNSFDEPHCEDPEDPLRDRRCYDDNPNIRR